MSEASGSGFIRNGNSRCPRYEVAAPIGARVATIRTLGAFFSTNIAKTLRTLRTNKL